jgi:hypothetical protein
MKIQTDHPHDLINIFIFFVPVFIVPPSFLFYISAFMRVIDFKHYNSAYLRRSATTKSEGAVYILEQHNCEPVEVDS